MILSNHFSNMDARLKKVLQFTTLFISLSLLAAAIWFAGPYITWGDYIPLAQPEKRAYLIALVFLSWALKFLIIDLALPNPLLHGNGWTRKKLMDAQKRFAGANKFLNKTSITKNNKKIRLSKLPGYLLLGPRDAGKTALLAHSGVSFILRKPATKSENCDWWVTREASIIDVPGKYLSTFNAVDETNSDDKAYHALWTFFLRLMRKKRGKSSIKGIIIALPAPEIIKQHDQKNYLAFIRDLFQRIQELQKMFAGPILCQLVITKCDLIPGFSEFFSEMNQDEITQTFGISLPIPKENEKLSDLFTARFNTQIKNLNQQLIWRLHQERNPDLRPLIKDFPLQIERIKEFTSDFIKKLSIIRLNVVVKGVYLTSALQPEAHTEKVTHQQNIHSQVVQIFREPVSTSRAFFVKQFLMQGMSEANMTAHLPSKITHEHFKIYAAYAASATFITVATIMLINDFRAGVDRYYVMQQDITAYQNKIAKIHNPAGQLLSTISLLDALQKTFGKKEFRFDLSYLFSIYSHESRRKAEIAYQKAYQNALHNILIPGIKTYFEEFLSNPTSKNTDDVYAVLKAYLMMGDAKHFDEKYLTSTLKKVLPSAIHEQDNISLIKHLQTTFSSSFTPMKLDNKKIQDVRKYLAALPTAKLSYVILKNMYNNNVESKIQIDPKNPISIFANEKLLSQMPVFFTAKMFNPVLTQQIEIALSEANSGNWVLGNNLPNKNQPIDTSLISELRVRYVSQYIEAWENLLDNIHLSPPADLAATDSLITNIIGNDSPLLRFLKIVHENTNFEPITLSSPKLQRVNVLVEKTKDSSKRLYTIFSSMQSLHQYLQTILHAENIKQAAYDAVATRMQSLASPDAITQLRMIAESYPAPIRLWLVKITDNSWNYLMQEAGQYLDLSWNTEVMPYYRNEIAGRYPFNTKGDQEVDFPQFTRFFGTTGIMPGFYNKYLQRFVDTSTADWHWKLIDGKPLPFSVETLRQIQYAMRIHQSFYPKGDNKLYVQFALQPYKFGKAIKSVEIALNDAQFTDSADTGNPHFITLNGNSKAKMTTIQFTMEDDKVISKQFPGNWGWFRLLNQSFESAITKKEILVNLSMNEHPAKYILSSASQNNPFSTMNLQLFHLPQQLTDEKV